MCSFFAHSKSFLLTGLFNGKRLLLNDFCSEQSLSYNNCNLSPILYALSHKGQPIQLCLYRFLMPRCFCPVHRVLSEDMKDLSPSHLNRRKVFAKVRPLKDSLIGLLHRDWPVFALPGIASMAHWLPSNQTIRTNSITAGFKIDTVISSICRKQRTQRL